MHVSVVRVKLTQHSTTSAPRRAGHGPRACAVAACVRASGVCARLLLLLARFLLLPVAPATQEVRLRRHPHPGARAEQARQSRNRRTLEGSLLGLALKVKVPLCEPPVRPFARSAATRISAALLAAASARKRLATRAKHCRGHATVLPAPRRWQPHQYRRWLDCMSPHLVVAAFLQAVQVGNACATRGK